MVVKTVRLPGNLIRAVKRRARLEGVDESTAIRQLIDLGVKGYSTRLYRAGRLTLTEAARLSNATVREMLDILADHGVKGNVRYDQQKKSLELVLKTTA